MPRLALVIGNKNYSSWSMRPWVLMRQAGIEFEEIALSFDDQARVPGAERYSPTRKVPVLLTDGEPVWDSLAICETLAEMFPGKQLWPADAKARRSARAACAEMHSGFMQVRSAMPMNIRASHPGKGMSEGVQRELDRIVELWRDCRNRFGRGGPMLFGTFAVPDAYYAPVAMRFLTYAPALPEDARTYMAALLELGAVREWMDAARTETGRVGVDEPYA